MNHAQSIQKLHKGRKIAAENEDIADVPEPDDPSRTELRESRARKSKQKAASPSKQSPPTVKEYGYRLL